MLGVKLKIQTPSGTYDIENYSWIDNFTDMIERHCREYVGPKELDDIAVMIQEDIVKVRILGGVSLTGGGYRPYTNPQRTLKAKGHLRPLVDKGNLARGIMIKNKSKHSREIYVGGVAKGYASHLAFNNKRFCGQSYNFFGVSHDVEMRISKYLQELDKNKSKVNA